MSGGPVGRVGVIGLGAMGLPMATRLAGAGFAVTGFDLDPARRFLAEAAGIAGAASATAALSGADAVLCSLPLAEHVEAVLDTPALLERRDRRVLVLDTSTADPGTTRRLAARLGAAGHAHLDAPVSGGPAGAAAGTLAVMIGGAAADVAAARPVLDAIAGSVVHVGPSGAGNVAKLVNNLLVAAHMLTVGEALRLSEAAGVAAADVLRVVNAATGRSALSEVHYPRWVLPGGYDSGFSAGLMRKDVRLAMAMADEAGVALPYLAEAARVWAESGVADAADFTRVSPYAEGRE